MEKVIFVDAQQMQKDNPSTFEAPTQKDLNRLTVNDTVKICAMRERFWVTIKRVDDEILTGVIDNDLVFTHEHGLSFDDVVKFERKNIYSIYEK